MARNPAELRQRAWRIHFVCMTGWLLGVYCLLACGAGLAMQRASVRASLIGSGILWAGAGAMALFEPAERRLRQVLGLTSRGGQRET